MLRRLISAAGALRPRSLARTAKTVEDLLAETQRLRHSMRDAHAESARLADQARQLEAHVRTLESSLAGLSYRESALAAVYRRDRELAAELERLPAVLDADAIAAHATRAIQSAPRHDRPFPHLVVEDVWPGTFHRALVTGIPPAEVFADRPVNKRRLVVPFEFAPLYGTRVWNFLVHDVLDRLAPAIVGAFEEPLTEWLRSEWPLPGEAPLERIAFQCTDGRILLRHRGYSIPPHRDPKWGLITCLLYLVRPGDSEGWGTQLYRVDGDTAAPSVAAYWIKPERCHLEKDVPFRRNSMLVFLNSHGAHGARIPGDAEPAHLERYMYQFRVGPTADSIRDLMQLLPEERRAAWAGKVADYN